MQHSHCARCQTFADKAISNAIVTGSLGSAYGEEDMNGCVLHGARVERDPITPLCAEGCGLASEPGDIYCTGCRSAVRS